MAMAVIDKLVNLGIPWSWAEDMSDGSPTVAYLMAHGCPQVLATEIVATDGEVDNAAQRVIFLPRLMAAGLTGNQAIEVFDLLADG